MISVGFFIYGAVFCRAVLLCPKAQAVYELGLCVSLCDTAVGSYPRAGMAELADAADSKSADPCGHGGSTPPPGTNKIKSLSWLGLSKPERSKLFGGCSDGCWLKQRVSRDNKFA